MRPPGFWFRPASWQAALLSPLEIVAATVTARRAAGPGWRAPVPVICCGNATVGGSGKTPLCLDILTRLRGCGVDAHALTRGHGGAGLGGVCVDLSAHDATMVGDEALLLAAVAPTWTGADRAASARAAIRAGAQALVMDDGLQNPTLHRDHALLTIDGGAGFGNNHLLPAGPLREPVSVAAARCQAAVLVGADTQGALAGLPGSLPVHRATMAPGPAMRALRGTNVVAFAGIGRPAKFFETLSDAGLRVAARIPFADHHRYTPRELAALRLRATRAAATLVTTTKDLARLPPSDRSGIVPLAAAIAWQDEAAFDALLRSWVP